MDSEGVVTGGVLGSAQEQAQKQAQKPAQVGRIDPVRRLDLAALSDVEPDILLADRWSEQFDLESVPYDLIDQSELDARRQIAVLDQRDATAFHARLRAMSAQAFARAIEICHQAALASEAAGAHRARAETSRKSAAYPMLERIAIRAERHAAIIGLEALREAHHARGVDAAVSLRLIGIEFAVPFGLVSAAPRLRDQDHWLSR